MSPKAKVTETRIITEGCIVHFVSNGKKHHVAIVTHVWSNTVVNLFVFPDASSPVISSTPTSVTHDETAATPYTWHWPEGINGNTTG